MYNFLKNIFYLALTVAIFFIPVKVFAISGTCSYHGGVNCLAGAAADGMVVCNDGWENSSVSFFNTDECNNFKNCLTDSDNSFFRNESLSADNLSSAEQQSVDTAGAQAGAGVDQSIQALQTDEDQDTAKLETAVAGYGGEFSSMAYGQAMNAKSAYEVQISYLKNSKTSTINAAKTAQIQSIKFYHLENIRIAANFLNAQRCNELTQQQIDINKAQALANIQLLQAQTQAKQFDNIVNQVAPVMQAEINAGQSISSVVQYYVNQGYNTTTLNSALIKYQTQNPNLINPIQTKNNATTTAIFNFNVGSTSSKAVIKNTIVKKYVVFTGVYNVRASATVASKILSVTKRTVKYEVIDLSNKNWVQIKIDSKRNGWVMKKFAKII
jgi:hypothetical protein